VVTVRGERAGDPADADAVRAVQAAAFPTDAEAKLLDALRESGDYDPAWSFVAEFEGAVVGHCLLTAAALERPDGTTVHGRIVALGPIAVLPALHGRGIGTRLMRAALARSERDRAAAVVLVGHPAYYARFGFAPARSQGLLPPGPWRDEVWLARRLLAWTIRDVGTVRYARPFMEME
jgi:putative acetyltransferase